MIGLNESDEKIESIDFDIGTDDRVRYDHPDILFYSKESLYSVWCGVVLCTLFHDPEKSKHLPCLPVGGWLELVCRTK